jgi:hypothetical protein
MRMGVLLLLAVSAGCTTARSGAVGSKALFAWAAAEAPVTADAEPAPDSIVTDRPDFTEASSTVGQGRLQLESGYTFFRDRTDGTTTQLHSFPEALLRVGMFEDWFEWRLGQNFGSQRVAGSGGTAETLTGAQDLYVGTKIALTEQSKWLPETAVIVQATLPTGRNGFTTDRVLPGVNYLFGWDVIPEAISLGGSVQGNLTRDDTGHSYLTLANSATVGYSLTEKTGAFTEFFAFYPSGAKSDAGPEYYFDGGFTYRLTNDLQFDIRGGVGLNRRADDFFSGAGFAYRY